MASEARGTTRPFELVGAPWVEAERFADDDERAQAARRALPAGGVRADVPEAREEDVRRVPDPRARSQTFKPVLTGVALIDAIKAAGPKDFAWRKPPYEYEHEKEPIDILAGLAGAPNCDRCAAKKAEELVPVWERESRPFEEVRAEYLVYE